MSTISSAAAPGENMRESWRKASVRPLWENPLAYNARTGGPPAHLWAWSELEPLVKAAMAMTSMAAIERRVLTLVDPAAECNAAGTTTNLTAALQILMPPHSRKRSDSTCRAQYLGSKCPACQSGASRPRPNVRREKFGDRRK